jgi:antitoxin VapB
MQIGSVFNNNRTQAVRLPTDTRFPSDVKRVTVRVVGETRIIAPLHKTWDDFFDGTGDGVSDDFMAERASQEQSDRESL